MISVNTLVVICVAYVAVLFLVAYLADRAAMRGRAGVFSSPLVYTLSISVYCTGWTYYGAVGSAARNGLEFVSIYLGPTLVFIGWWWSLRRLVETGREQRITSIADLISSRYGKSPFLGVIVTLLAVIGTTPYIALQLQSLTLSISVFIGSELAPYPNIPLWIAIGLGMFTTLFGTRTLDADERHHGVVMAIALEAVVKLIALICVGFFVVWGISGGIPDILERLNRMPALDAPIVSSRWTTLMFLSASAIICLPRMFQVIVVENASTRQLAVASWAFPLYLILMSLFVLPIAAVGLDQLGTDANPDFFVLSLPLAFENQTLAVIAFLGGFSASTSMVIVAAIALSTMVSNHIIMPLWLRATRMRSPESSDVKNTLLRARRLSITVIIALGYAYFVMLSRAQPLASIGVIAFLGLSQVLPALIGGLFWPNATRKGAIAGIITGFTLWAYTLFLPSLFQESMTGLLPELLTPQALFGMQIEDPLIHATLWSIGGNVLAFLIVSLAFAPSAIEERQKRLFSGAHEVMPGSTQGPVKSGDIRDYHILAERIIGRDETRRLFAAIARTQGLSAGQPIVTPRFISTLEREFAGSVGAATAHAMIAQITRGDAASVEDLIAVADETAQIMEYSARLETQSRELARTARELRDANEKLTSLSAQKDVFLSQVSHELRTPMTSIRSFAEILRDTQELSPEALSRFASIIHDESQRLTGLLDEILDLSFLESGRIRLKLSALTLREVIERAILSCETQLQTRSVEIRRHPKAEEISLTSDFDRLSQVFINLITNALKYGCDADRPVIRIETRHSPQSDHMEIEISDNGPGIPHEDREVIFEKFSKLSQEESSGSAGLGLPISREILRNLGGKIELLPTPQGATFRIILPLTPPDTHDT